jgi:dsDNA-specific endonuclease/ATPase MutS2
MSESRSIDLHSLTVAEAIREFVRYYNACARSGYRGRLEIIHGYGSSGSGGVIREELRRYLKAHEETFGEFLAGESLRNPGVTIVYPRDTMAATPPGSGACDSPMQGMRSRSTKAKTGGRTR